MNFSTVASLAIIVVALLHVVFFVLESFFWTKPLGLRVFGMNAELAAGSASLAFNQGVYNAFLAAGLVWGLFAHECNVSIETFFLICVLIAGIVGGITAKRSILFIQGLPAAVALLLVLFAHR